MDPAALAGLCLLLARGPSPSPLPPGVVCPPVAAAGTSQPILDGVDLAARTRAPEARDGIARVAFAEAGNQGDSGLAGVVYTILNRLADGRWGSTVDSVLNAPRQFEPVMRAGGDWRRLPPASAAGQARIDTILNLALEGRLPDLTKGARFFQNPAIVAARARAGTVAPGLVNFGGQSPSAVIGAHSFYTGAEGGGRRVSAAPGQPAPAAPDSLFVGENRRPSKASMTADERDGDAAAMPPKSAAQADPGRGLFVGRDGSISFDQP